MKKIDANLGYCIIAVSHVLAISYHLTEYSTETILIATNIGNLYSPYWLT